MAIDWNEFFHLGRKPHAMQRTILFILLGVIPSLVGAQRAQRLMFNIQGDLIKSDNDGFFEKAQGGVEGCYYFSRKIAATGGAEWWTGSNALFPVLGMRLCPIDEAFVRLRGLWGKDLSIGGGFARPLSENTRIEAIADFYLQGEIAIRAGISYGIGPRP